MVWAYFAVFKVYRYASPKSQMPITLFHYCPVVEFWFPYNFLDYSMLHNKTTTNDFNLPVAFRPFPHKGLADELWANRFFSNHGPAPSLGFPQMRQTISWRPKNTKILLHGPISLHGIRSIDLPGELARHRSMPARQPVETLSHGHSIPKGLEPSTFGSTGVSAVPQVLVAQ